MAAVGKYSGSLKDLEHGNRPDLVVKAVRFVLREEDKREEPLTVLDSANAIASIKNESPKMIMTEATFSQGGQI
jgi:hypothetical protein